MKDLFLIMIMIGLFVFGYYIMTKVDCFINETQRLIAAGNREGKSKIRIAAESTVLLDTISSNLEKCLNADPHISFLITSGNADVLLEKLMDEQVDIILLTEDSIEKISEWCASLFVESQKDDEHCYIVWKKNLRSRNRDRVIFIMGNEYCRDCA